jgi:hypothetical protein
MTPCRPLAAVVLAVLTAACRDSPRQPDVAAPIAETAVVEATDRAAAPGGPVQIEMKNVRLHMGSGIVLDVGALRGEMISARRGQPPVFDDPRSYLVRVFTADVSMDMASLTHLMNHHVFGGEHPPLSDIDMTVDDGRLKQTATLHKGLALPVTLVATVGTTPDGRLRLRTEKVSTVGIPVKGLLDLFNIELADLLTLKTRHGIEIDENDVILSPGRILPPPQMDGHVARVEVAGNRLRQVFDNGRRAKPLAPEAGSTNYVYFVGNVLRFGRLTMVNADLRLIDADAGDPFEFFPAQYDRQLVAGYSKNTPEGALRTYMPDYTDLQRGK